MLTYVSVFSGAGGLDLGLDAAGWTALAQVECDDGAVGTLELAARRRAKDREGLETRVIASLIEKADPASLRRSLGLRRGQLELLAGGPPCQPFTTHGLRQSIIDRRASAVWPGYLAYVDEFKPKALLIENVDGLLSAALRHRPLLDRGSDGGATGGRRAEGLVPEMAPRRADLPRLHRGVGCRGGR